MKIVLLDFDGVLNDSNWLRSLEERSWIGMIDPSKVELLNQIIKETEAKIVVSSSWRIQNSTEQLQDMLDRCGFNGEVIGCTPAKLSNCFRGNEIQWWLNKHPEVEKFVILDDESDMLHLKDHLVQTSFGLNEGENGVGGLKQEHVNEVIRRLNDVIL